MESMENLARLERAVDKLINTVGKLQGEKRELLEKLAANESEIEKLVGKLHSLTKERGQIEKRVNGLLDAIDKWEKQTDISEKSEEMDSETIEKTLF